MLHLVLDIQSTAHSNQRKKLKAWVNTRSHDEALSILCEHLSLQGWVMTDVVESSITDESDYSAPCEALDAFNEARCKEVAIRFYSNTPE